METGGQMHRRWRELNKDDWGSRLFVAGIVLMCSPVITVLFAGTVTILAIVYAGAVISGFGMVLGLSASRK
jgi:hypothetical protein